MEIDDKTLTLFLIDCMTEMFERSIKTSEFHVVQGLVRRGLKKDGLKYLELIAGTAQCSNVDILVYTDSRAHPIFKMNVVSMIDMEAVARNFLVYTDVLRVLQNARMNGFARTKTNIAQKREFNLFNIPAWSEPAPVARGGLPGNLKYEEGIEDCLDFFGGGEEIHFYPDATHKQKVRLYRSQLQGNRLI